MMKLIAIIVATNALATATFAQTNPANQQQGLIDGAYCYGAQQAIYIYNDGANGQKSSAASEKH
jgi:hypothetical protein